MLVEDSFEGPTCVVEKSGVRSVVSFDLRYRLNLQKYSDGRGNMLRRDELVVGSVVDIIKNNR